MRLAARGTGTLAVAALVGCASMQASDLPREEPWLVVVKSARLDGRTAWYKRFAHHTWVDVKLGSDEGWTRLESAGSLFGTRVAPLEPDEAYLNRRFDDHPVRVLGVVRGETARALAPRLVERVTELGAFYDERYTAWPGPNSNTLMMTLAREFPDLRFVFDGSAAGKDYGGWLDASLTASGTGVRLDSIPIGVALAAREGIELHLLQLTLGIGFDPPCIKIPFLPTFPTDVGGGAPVPRRPTGSFERTVALAPTPGTETRHPLGTLPGSGRAAVTESSEQAWTEVVWSLGPLVPGAEGGDERSAFMGISLTYRIHGQSETVEVAILGHQIDLDRPTDIAAPHLSGLPWSIEWTRRADGTLEACLVEPPAVAPAAAREP